jgi:hypothetical protein
MAVELLRCRAGERADFEVEACDAKGRLALPSNLVHGSGRKEMMSRLLETIVLCLSVRIHGYDDPNFDIPSATLSLHLQSCEIVSASLSGFGQAPHATEKHSSRTV